ncbi:Fic family protein [Belliella sp. DSM 107340]|uniref:Fic family protein n=1 Tax=Belliella calami TaxID=2923436 RepID=A0ABS9UQG9_9BACT|nr:Fic family protein [Belliella calami]MCH7398877.1 Fic family protein [Belliella calami]
MKFKYFDLNHAVLVQNYIIENSGGRKGVLNIDLLSSVLDHVKNDIYYPDLESKVCHLFYSINKNHAFNDGNKRSSIVLASYFLEINGCNYLVSRFMKEMENIAVYVADNKIDKELLHEIIVDLIYKPDYSESLKLKIAIALMK